jgi:predicted cobalt transporter CbtA
VSPQRVQVSEGTRILSPFSDWRIVRVPLGLELLRMGFFLRLYALSLYVSSGILLMPPPDARPSSCPSSLTNRYVCLFPSLSAL